jgi:hypothetical protein
VSLGHRVLIAAETPPVPQCTSQTPHLELQLQPLPSKCLQRGSISHHFSVDYHLRGPVDGARRRVHVPPGLDCARTRVRSVRSGLLQGGARLSRLHRLSGPTTSIGGAVEASECLCAEGHAALGGTCAPCPAGTYKSFVGNNSRRCRGTRCPC